MMDWNGVVASIVFAGGCNFRCLYCHNYSLAFTPEKLDSIPDAEIFDKINRMKGWVDGVIVSGGEPTLQADGLTAFLKKAKKKGLKTKLFTNGSMPDVIKGLIADRLLDAVSMDVKHRPERYKEVVTVDIPDITACIARSIRLLKDSGAEVEFRMTTVKGLHSFEDIRAVKELVKPKTLILQNVNESDIPEGNKEMIIPFTATEFEELEKLNH